jgi:hypothetical protein
MPRPRPLRPPSHDVAASSIPLFQETTRTRLIAPYGRFSRLPERGFWSAYHQIVTRIGSADSGSAERLAPAWPSGNCHTFSIKAISGKSPGSVSEDNKCRGAPAVTGLKEIWTYDDPLESGRKALCVPGPASLRFHPSNAGLTIPRSFGGATRGERHQTISLRQQPGKGNGTCSRAWTETGPET